jgi:hypothetical protein
MTFEELLLVKPDDRTVDWERQFLQLLPSVNCEVMAPEPQMGPDGWPYLLVKTRSPNASEPVSRIFEWLSQRGIGLVVNPDQTYPDYVLSFGMVWNYVLKGKFVELSAEVRDEAPQSFSTTSETFIGEPRPEIFPESVRKILREFFRDQGVLRPRILGVSPDGVKFELAFSLESIGNPPEKEHAGIAEALAWFLAPDCPVILMSEKGQPAFVDL